MISIQKLSAKQIMDIISLLKALPDELQRMIIYKYLPRNSCADLLIRSKTIYLKYVRNFIFEPKYKTTIWEALRPSKIHKLNYGDGEQFLILRSKMSKGELILLNLG